ncbi:hypothetical protein POTOM_041893 [Populus tomentosa]|uniref:non-specific serine/threonine protein kinase n=1 Tax=Populus tomentosa TaxID=118781 RepID=A0A8X8CGH8_POPTO|nr:hypothetical protein POTOM_041893 [Populus tomentosa]
MVAHLLLLLYQHHPIITIFLVLVLASASYGKDDNKDFRDCEKHFNCGIVSNLSYPFWGGDRPEVCGHKGFKLKCEKGQLPIIPSDTLEFRLFRLDQPSRLMTLRLVNSQDYICPSHTLPNSSTESDIHVFGYDLKLKNLNLLYNCTVSSSSSSSTLEQNRISSSYSYCSEYSGSSFYGGDDILESSSGLNRTQCSIWFKIPIPVESFRRLNGDTPDLEQVLGEEFSVSYKYDEGPSICDGCMASKGICGTNLTDPKREFLCLCRDHPYSLVCKGQLRNNDVMNVGRKVRMALGASLGTVIIMSIAFFFWYRHKKRQYVSFVSRSIESVPSSKANMEKRGSYNGVHLFSYDELEEATNNFDETRELGDGGFGTVYYGKLPDGREVAVKRLYENNYKRLEQFLNEVDILTRLSNKNLVLLYGCTSRHSRELLLVYEYIPNGTLADHLHGQRAKPGALTFPTRMNIAVETASALAYLHASDIVHRDVKTTNILLGNDFRVKVADFGLSRLFPLDVTHVSTAPQGTPGYVDPEYHQCYQLTDKSDVYSFGVVLIELISSMPAVDISRHRHEINLSNMAINKIQSNALNELVDPSLGFESDYAARKMISAVAELAFQCLQSARELRPSMEKVVEILKDIQSRDYTAEKAEETDIPSDDVVLLKSGPMPLDCTLSL